MIEIQGFYNAAVCFCDEMEESAARQIRAVCDMQAFANCKIRVMPDVHAGKGCTIGKYRREMQGVYSSCIAVDTLDESPMAYKSMDSILAQIGPSVGVVCRIVPVYNFKASE